MNTAEINRRLEEIEKTDQYNNPDTGKIIPYSGAWFRGEYCWGHESYTIALIGDWPCFDVKDCGDYSECKSVDDGERDILRALIVDLVTRPCNENRESVEAYLAKLFSREIARYKATVKAEYDRLYGEKEER